MPVFLEDDSVGDSDETILGLSIYESAEAGKRLNEMLSMGLSQPWPEALEKIAGTKQMDATAILDYFKPLDAWLDQQIRGKPVGW